MVIIDAGIVAVLYFAALAWGSNEPWAMALVSMTTLVILAVSVVWETWRGKVKIAASWTYVPLLLFLAYCSTQAILLKRDFNSENSWLPHTTERHSTIMYLLLAASCVAIVFLVQNGFRSRARVKLLVISILVLGAFEALYGLTQYFGEQNHIWDYTRQTHIEVATGTFINRNHYALLLNLIICIGIGFLYYRSTRLLRGGKLAIRRILFAPGSARLAWLLVWLALMGLAVVFSMSRMGIVAMFCCLGIAIAAATAAQTGKRAMAIGLILVFAIIGLAVYTGLDSVLARYENLSQERASERDRIVIWRDAWKMIQNYPLFGQGLGTFQWTYRAYETFDPDIPATYAHNDYLQALAEVGITGLVLILWALGLTWRLATENLFNTGDPLARGIGLGTLGGLTAMMLQEATDFSLYIPGVALTAAVLVGLNLRGSALHPRDQPQ